MAWFRGAVVALCLTAVLTGCSSSSTGTNPDGGSLAAVPAGVAARGGDAQATVSWTAAGGASTYNVYYGTASGVTPASPTRVTGATGTSTVVTGLANGTT